VQDTWRLSRKLSLTAGVRHEYEGGVTEANDAMVVGFDPTTTLAITQLAEAAYAAVPIPQRAPGSFKVRGGPVYASADGTSWSGQSMWMPRLSGAYSLTDKMVLKAGYGMYYDTLNATAFTPLQTGFSQNTTSDLSVDFGQTFLLGDPKKGISPMRDPFPVQANGQRFQSVLGSSLGVNTVIGENHTAPNSNTEHARVQRCVSACSARSAAIWRSRSPTTAALGIASTPPFDRTTCPKSGTAGATSGISRSRIS
jgi:hypothetical protein